MLTVLWSDQWVHAVLFPLQFPMGPGSDGPLGAMAGMEPHHMNGSLGNTTHYNTLTNTEKNFIQTKVVWVIHWKTMSCISVRATNWKFISCGHKIKQNHFFVSLLGSGDMDGMNKVNIVTMQIDCIWSLILTKVET